MIPIRLPQDVTANKGTRTQTHIHVQPCAFVSEERGWAWGEGRVNRNRAEKVVNWGKERRHPRSGLDKFVKLSRPYRLSLKLGARWADPAPFSREKLRLRPRSGSVAR